MDSMNPNWLQLFSMKNDKLFTATFEAYRQCQPISSSLWSVMFLLWEAANSATHLQSRDTEGNPFCPTEFWSVNWSNTEEYIARLNDSPLVYTVDSNDHFLY